MEMSSVYYGFAEFNGMDNLVPRLSSLRFSLEEETWWMQVTWLPDFGSHLDIYY